MKVNADKEKELYNIFKIETILASSDVDGLMAYLYAPGATKPIALPASRSGAQTDQGVHSEWITSRTLQIDLVAGDLSAWDGH